MKGWNSKSVRLKRTCTRMNILTRREVAARCRVPLSTFDSLRRQARVPFPDARMGKHMLWKASTIDVFLGGGGTGVSL